jgi:hypothetical protein
MNFFFFAVDEVVFGIRRQPLSSFYLFFLCRSLCFLFSGFSLALSSIPAVREDKINENER